MTQSAPARLIVGPFNRVEGDLEVSLDIQDGHVVQARVTAPLYRGFERLLAGRPAEDALVIAPRICGICSVSQSTAAARALADAVGLIPPDNGRLAADLVLACENAADHLTHFVLFFMPDFARPVYAARPWHHAVHDRLAANQGSHTRLLLAARAKFLHLMGILAGKWPHSLALQPGGTTKAADRGEQMRLIGILAGFRHALETCLFGDRLETVAALSSPAQLWAWADAAPWDQGDMRLFLHLARDLGLDRLGRGAGDFLSHGGFGLWPAGLAPRQGGAVRPVDQTQLAEDLSSAWMADADRPDADKPGAYSWCKAPRLNGQVAEVGALARQVVAGDGLALGLVADHGGTVLDRVVMRLVELARLVLAMDGWARAIRPGDPFCLPFPAGAEGSGAGLVEAARGALGHWLRVDRGMIQDYRIIAPTTWNFSPRDANGQPGPLEQALAGAPILPGETTPLSVQHIVRSFDPCMACTVH